MRNRLNFLSSKRGKWRKVRWYFREWGSEGVREWWSEGVREGGSYTYISMWEQQRRRWVDWGLCLKLNTGTDPGGLTVSQLRSSVWTCRAKWDWFLYYSATSHHLRLVHSHSEIRSDCSYWGSLFHRKDTAQGTQSPLLRALGWDHFLPFAVSLWHKRADQSKQSLEGPRPMRVEHSANLPHRSVLVHSLCTWAW